MGKLSCERFDKLISLFLDGRLDQDKERELKEHLSECERCAKKLALLESVEGRARKIEAKEPPQEYWDNFASRVRGKIIEREEKSFAFGLKKALQSIFSFSPLKIKVAAGLVSVVLVFIIGKLYVDYRGEEIFPSKTVVQKERPPQLDITKIEKKKGFPIEDGRRGIESISEKPEMKKEPPTAVQREEKTTLPKKVGGEKEVLPKEDKAPVQPKVSEETPAPAYITDLSTGVPPATEKPPELIVSPKADQAGAGVEKKDEGPQETKIQVQEEKVSEEKELSRKREAGKLTPKDVSLPSPTTGFRPYSADDTLTQVNELRRTIQVWKAYIEENPTDSLTNQGYLQVAMSYYLLAKLSQDTTVISEGSKVIEEYLDQIEDRKVKEELGGKLKKIKALRQR